MTFTIAQTNTTPLACFKDGHLIIKGRSLPFDNTKVYDMIGDRLMVYSQHPKRHTQVDFNLSVINAVSKIYIINTFRILEYVGSKDTNIHVNWYYQKDNEDVQELGEICKSIFKIDIIIQATE